MSEDEVFVTIISLGLSVFLWGRWLWQCIRLHRARVLGAGTAWMNASAVGTLAIVYLLLKHFASHDVRDSAQYLFFYMAMGGAVLGIAQFLFPLADLIPRDDVLERGNRAAAYGASGGILGLGLCYAGANMGDGPGWWVVVFCVVLAGGTWLVSWIVYGRTTGIMDSVTVVRDDASGIRLAGYLIGSGLILGRAVAGNWVSTGATLFDFGRHGWPVLPLLALAVVVEPVLRPSGHEPDKPVLLYGWPALIAFVGLSVLAVFLQGSWL